MSRLCLQAVPDVDCRESLVESFRGLPLEDRHPSAPPVGAGKTQNGIYNNKKILSNLTPRIRATGIFPRA
jgi:hypothetical protein